MSIHKNYFLNFRSCIITAWDVLYLLSLLFLLTTENEKKPKDTSIWKFRVFKQQHAFVNFIWDRTLTKSIMEGIPLKEAVCCLSTLSQVKVTRSQWSLVWISDLESTLEELNPRFKNKKFFKTKFLLSPRMRANCVSRLQGSCAVSEVLVSVLHRGDFFEALSALSEESVTFSFLSTLASGTQSQCHWITFPEDWLALGNHPEEKKPQKVCSHLQRHSFSSSWLRPALCTSPDHCSQC